jgi:hypothetical protein
VDCNEQLEAFWKTELLTRSVLCRSLKVTPFARSHRLNKLESVFYDFPQWQTVYASPERQSTNPSRPGRFLRPSKPGAGAAGSHQKSMRGSQHAQKRGRRPELSLKWLSVATRHRAINLNLQGRRPMCAFELNRVPRKSRRTRSNGWRRLNIWNCLILPNARARHK